MKAYRLEVLVVDHDGLGGEEIKATLEGQKYPNYCMYPQVMHISEADIGLWADDHPLNQHSTAANEYHRLFDAAQTGEPPRS